MVDIHVQCILPICTVHYMYSRILNKAKLVAVSVLSVSTVILPIIVCCNSKGSTSSQRSCT